MAKKDGLRKVDKIPEGYVKGDVINGKQTYKKTTSEPGNSASAKPVQKTVVKKAPSTSNSNSNSAPVQRKPLAPKAVKAPPINTEDIVYMEDPVVSAPVDPKSGLYGSIDINRKLLPKSTPNQPYDTYQYPDENGNYTNKATNKYFVNGQEIDINKSLQGNNFNPSYVQGSNVNSGTNVGGMTRIMQPTDSNVNTENTQATNLTMPGVLPTKNTFGGAGLANPNNTTDQVDIPKFDASGKPIPKAGTMPKFKKGGLVGKLKGYAVGGNINYNEGNDLSGVVGQNDPYAQQRIDQDNQNKRKAQGKQVANAAGQALGGLGSSYYNSQQSTNEGDNARSAGLAAVSQTGAIGGVIGGLAAIGDKLGKPTRTRSEQVDASNGELKNESMAKRNAAIGIALSPSKRLTYKGGLTDVTGRKYLDSIENKTKEQLREVNAANTKSRQQQAIAANEANDFNATITNPYDLSGASFDSNQQLTFADGTTFDKNRPTYKMGGLVQKCAQGGKIVGKGTAKSDSIKAEIKEDSYVVPAENAKVAEAIRKVVLKAPSSKKAELKQKDGEAVLLSNGEHLFTPKEVEKIEAAGIDLDKLAPDSDNDKMYAKGGPIKGQKVGNATFDGKRWVDVNGNVYPQAYVDKVLKQAEQNKINQQKKDNQERLGLLTRHYERIKDQPGRETEIANLKKEINQLSGNTSSNKSSFSSPSATTSKIKVPASTKKANTQSLAQESMNNALSNQDADNSVIVPVNKNGKITQEAIKDAEQAKALNDSALAADYRNNPLVTKPNNTSYKKGILSKIGNVDPTAFVGIGQSALGLNMLAGLKRPVDKAVLDPTYNDSVNRSIRDASYGLTPEQSFVANQDIQNSLNDSKYVGLANSGGNGVQAFNTNRAAINDAWKQKLGLKTADTNLRMEKQQYADQMVANRASILAYNRRQAFNDAMDTFQQKQQAGSELIGAGLANTIGAYRFKQDEKSRAEADRLRGYSLDNYGKM